MILKSKSTGLEYTAEYDSEDQDYLKLTPLADKEHVQHYHRDLIKDCFDFIKGGLHPSMTESHEALVNPASVDLKETDGKYQPSVFPVEAIKAFWEVSEYGRKKYGDRNSWKNATEDGVEKYSNAAMRHLHEGSIEIDVESKLPHIYAALWNAAVAVWHYERGNF